MHSLGVYCPMQTLVSLFHYIFLPQHFFYRLCKGFLTKSLDSHLFIERLHSINLFSHEGLIHPT